MSRSRRRHTAMKIAGHSDKRDKQSANRRFRKMAKMLLKADNEALLPDRIRAVSDRWAFNSDGGAYWWSDMSDEYKRK